MSLENGGLTEEFRDPQKIKYLRDEIKKAAAKIEPRQAPNKSAAYSFETS